MQCFSPNSIHQQFNRILHEGATWCTARRSTGAQVRQKEARARGSHLNKVTQPLKLRMGTGAPQMAAHQTSQLEHPIHQTSQHENPKITKPLKLRTQIAKPLKLFPQSVQPHNLSDQITKPSTSMGKAPT